jgi:hypothetical protein
MMQGTQWWTDYQPVSYIIESKRGTRAEYQSMIETCHAAGVKVIAGRTKLIFSRTRLTASSDTIWNHMAGISSGKHICLTARLVALLKF